jgi:hypothetical protein
MKAMSIFQPQDLVIGKKCLVVPVFINVACRAPPLYP